MAQDDNSEVFQVGSLVIADFLPPLKVWRGSLGSILFLILLLTLCGRAHGQPSISVQLAPSVPSPQALGTTLTWVATAVDSAPGPVTYQFQVSQSGSSTFSMVQDFSLSNTFQWTPNVQEGTYTVQVIARDYVAGTQNSAVSSFVITPLAIALPVVVPTANPLVALFSAPSCPAGSFMRVAFLLSGQNASQATQTNLRPCHPPTTMNFYIAGMYPNSTYYLRYVVQTGSTVTLSPTILPFTTGSIPSPSKFATNTVIVPPTTQSYTTSDVVFNGFANWKTPGTSIAQLYPEATDLSGNVQWYLPRFSQIPRLVTGDPLYGTTLLLIDGTGLGTGTGPGGGSIPTASGVWEVDLANNVIRQTNSDRISEQLVAMGTDPVFGLNHEAIRLANGHTLVIGSPQRMYPAGTQGSAGPVDVIGLMLVELDSNFQVVWYWNAFDHAGGGTQLDITRPSTRGITCVVNQDGCPSFLLSSPANDWLHANSIQYQPLDGSLVVSLRNQDWVIKIDYNNGLGTQQVLWRLGLGGDFTMNSSISSPWFSGQHDAEFQYGGNTVMSLFDDGNTRIALNPGQGSRGQVLYVNQTNMTAGLILNQSLGVVSVALGSAQLLPNGNYWFDAGWDGITPTIPGVQQGFEITPSGSVAYEIQGSSTSYRSWRMPDLYTLPTFTSVPAMTLSCPANTATHGTPYSSPLVATGGVAPYTFSQGPALPPGLTLNATTGVISGTPTAPGTYTFGLQAADILKVDKTTKNCIIAVN